MEWPVAFWNSMALPRRAEAADEYPADEMLLRPYRDRVARIVHLLMSDSRDASLVMSETFSKLSRDTNCLDGDRSLRIQVFRVAVSSIRNRQRWWNWHERQSTSIPLEDEGALVLYGLRSLPRRYSIVLALRDIEGLSYSEIAEVLGLSTKTVKSRLSRARSLMLTSMNKATFLCAVRTFLPVDSVDADT